MKIVLIGTGNVAGIFGRLFQQAGHTIMQVYGRDPMKAAILSKILGGSHTSKLEDLEKDADIYLIAVSDDAIKSIASQLKLKGQLIVHTAGAVTAEILAQASSNYGVFYPLQSLKEKLFQKPEIPILVEASSHTNLHVLQSLAHSIGAKCQECTGDQRLAMHMAAIWVNNFPNLLYSIAFRICRENQLDFTLLKPLISSTASRISGEDPKEWQTGPASRNDQQTMESHLKLLEEHPQWQNIYRQLSDEIQRIN